MSVEALSTPQEGHPTVWTSNGWLLLGNHDKTCVRAGGMAGPSHKKVYINCCVQFGCRIPCSAFRFLHLQILEPQTLKKAQTTRKAANSNLTANCTSLFVASTLMDGRVLQLQRLQIDNQREATWGLGLGLGSLGVTLFPYIGCSRKDCYLKQAWPQSNPETHS